MKRSYFLLLLLPILLLSGCSGGLGRDEAKVSAYLTALPNDYHELAERRNVIYNDPDGDFFTDEATLRRWYSFYDAVQAGRPASVVTAKLGGDGGIIYYYADYDGRDLWAVRDLTRDGWAGHEAVCKVFRGTALRREILPRDGRYWVIFTLEDGESCSDLLDLYDYWSETEPA